MARVRCESLLRRLVAATLLLCFPICAVQAQQAPQPSQPLVVRTGLDLIQLDAVVTDKQGHYITDLGPEDFAIYEDGHSQKITNCSYVSLGSVAPDVVDAPQVSTSPVVRAARPPTVLVPEGVRRTIVLLVDDLNTDMASIGRLRKSITAFVDREVQPGDLVSIALSGRGSGNLQQFTADKEILRQAAANVRFNLMAGADAFPTADTGSLLSRHTGGPGSAGEAQNNPTGGPGLDLDSLMYGTISALRVQLSGLRDMPGRKSVMLFSRGFRVRDAQNVLTPWGRALPGLVELANRSSTVIYAIDPIGVTTRSMTAADNVVTQPEHTETSDSAFEQHVAQLGKERADRSAELDGLRELAGPTGGELYRGNNDPAAQIGRVLDDQQGYYLIGYVPLGATFQMEGNRPAFHHVKIEVKRKGLKVRSRSGFYGVADTDPRLVQQTKALALQTALLSPFASTAVAMRLTSLFFKDPARGLLLHSFLTVPASALTFVRADDGSYSAKVELMTVTLDSDGAAVDQMRRSGELKLSSEGYERAQRVGVQYVIDVPVKKPGPYQLRVALRDQPSDRLGSAFQFVKVPDVGKKRLALSGILLSSGVSDGEAAAKESVSEPSYAQVFAAGQSLTYGIAIYPPPRGQDGKHSSVAMQTRIVGGDGREVVKGDPRPIDVDELAAKGSLAGGTFLLPASLAAGDYVLQVTVSDRTGGDKPVEATQAVAFELAGDKLP